MGEGSGLCRLVGLGLSSGVQLWPLRITCFLPCHLGPVSLSLKRWTMIFAKPPPSLTVSLPLGPWQQNSPLPVLTQSPLLAQPGFRMEGLSGHWTQVDPAPRVTVLWRQVSQFPGDPLFGHPPVLHQRKSSPQVFLP